MTQKMVWMFIAAVGAATLLPGANESFARSGAAPAGARAIGHPPGAFLQHRHHRPRGATFWPAGGYYDGPSGGAMAYVPPPEPESRDVRHTYTYEVPWDWAHRYPPNVVPTDRPYVSSCNAEPVRVPGRNGEMKTINITRCY